MNRSLSFPSAAAAIVLSVAAIASAQSPLDVKIKPTEVRGSIYMLEGQGGNIGVSIGNDGVFMIDDQFAPLTGRILAAVGELTEEPVRFVLNTHWHGDHTGGNENMGQTGAVLVAHENVRTRMSTEQFIEAFDSRVPPSPPDALPVVTFTDVITFHWNGDELHVFHVENAHTDGDAVVHFRRSNVLHAGDIYFNGMYPFIDVSSGGSVDGMIAGVDRILPLCNENTRIIPGHGPLSGPDELRTYRRMLVTARDAIRPMVEEGKTRDEVVAARPTRDLDDAWGGGFMQPDAWVGIVYDGMKR